MKKLIIILFALLTFTSCNIMEAVGLAEEKIDDSYFKSSLHENLVGFWRFSEAQGANRVSSQGAGYFVDTASTPQTAGKKGTGADCSNATSGSFLFNSNGSVDFTQIATSNFAISFWVYKASNPTNTCPAEETVFSSNGGEFVIYLGNIDCQADAAEIKLYHNGFGYTFVDDVVDFSGGQGHHFVINFNGGGQMELYVDGSYKASEVNPNVAIPMSTFGLCSFNAGTIKLNGAIDSVGLWNRTLTQNEISSLSSTRNMLD